MRATAYAWPTVLWTGLLFLPVCSDNADEGSDGDADGDSDGDADGDSDGDTDPLPCDGNYPEGPYDWYMDATVPATQFKAIYGPDGDETVFDMCEVYKNKDTVKSLVFRFGEPDT